jgi:hypothetical protein
MRQALELALEALDLSHPRFGIGTAKHISATAALRQAIAKTEQEQGEPVACLHRLVDVTNPVVKSGYMCMDCGAVFRAYATPQQRTWVGLTMQDVKVIEDNAPSIQMAIFMTEATLKDKNNGNS